ncbi:hypothetical protein HA402_008788 [Bradysia odoriphaga]|nr:hypothetical protein HA402_008788 [Bradysia odoriphaga]
MALKLLNLQTICERGLIGQIPLLTTVRFGHRLRGKPPGIAKTLEQRLSDEKDVDPEIEEMIDIGFPQPFTGSKADKRKEQMAYIKSQRQSSELEKLARTQTLVVDLNDVKTEWLSSNGQRHIKEIASHYGVFEHLFGKYAYFLPRVPLTIKYPVNETDYLPVYYGNLLKPSEAAKQPEVSFDSNINLTRDKQPSKDTLWSLVLTNPDGHHNDSEQEYVHWFISNIPNGDVSKGETIVPYIQPFPVKGTGYHRHIFVLYKQEKKLDFSKYKVNKINDLASRTFKTFDFYKSHQDDITPAGLAFFQSSWEQSLTEFYHRVLDMKEPIYEYDFPKPYIRDQMWFPLRQPFNLYLDKYRDPKEIAKEFIDRKLANTHPFNGPKPPLRWPNAHPFLNTPSWLQFAKMKSRLGFGRIQDY